MIFNSYTCNKFNGPYGLFNTYDYIAFYISISLLEYYCLFFDFTFEVLTKKNPRLGIVFFLKFRKFYFVSIKNLK